MHPQDTLASPPPPHGHGSRGAELPAPGPATSLQALRAAGGRGWERASQAPPPLNAHSLPISFSLDFFKQQVCLILPMSLEPHGVAGGGNDPRGCSQASTQALNSLALPRTSGVTSILQVGETKPPRGRPVGLELAGEAREKTASEPGCPACGPGWTPWALGARPRPCSQRQDSPWWQRATALGVFLPSAASLPGFSPWRALPHAPSGPGA